ncbi:hypothetical protein PMAYCL1PPCAC_13300, partial [Pristionchus mayeri]
MVSRHITKIRITRRSENSLIAQFQVVELCEKVHGIVEEHPDIVVWNADQIGLVKEATGKRTLARKGMKKVECVAPSVGATTSSITLLSIFRSDGYLKPKIFVQFGERGGVLPQKG